MQLQFTEAVITVSLMAGTVSGLPGFSVAPKAVPSTWPGIKSHLLEGFREAIWSMPLPLERNMTLTHSVQGMTALQLSGCGTSGNLHDILEPLCSYLERGNKWPCLSRRKS